MSSGAKVKTKRSSGSRAQASALENEMKNFLGSRSRTTAYRAATYKPSLEKFQSTSFSDYVRKVLMGVPIENVEAENAYFSSGEESESDEGKEVVSEVSKVCEDSCQNAMPSEISHNIIGKESSSADALATLNNTNHRITIDKSKPSLQKKEEVPGRMTTRSRSGNAGIQSKVEKENIYSKNYQYKMALLSQSSTPVTEVTSPRPQQQRVQQEQRQAHKPKIKRVLGPPLVPDNLKLSDGIAKITPPEGWWDKAGIGKDATARGQPWQRGNRLGDMVIPQPIKQCVAGIGGIYDFTMMELPKITVAEFRDKSDVYRKKQMGKEVDDDESGDHMDFLARKFWKRLGPTMESSQYGADMEGTLFDGAEACGWNVDQLESCLGLLEADYKYSGDIDKPFRLPGVTSAYLYFGMWASVFSAHTEDMNLLSINYLHAGAPKYWYAIAQEDSGRFESLMASMFSHQSTTCSEFLRHKRSLLSPNILTKAGISYTTQVQRQGDIVITFPGSYHFGFNTGFNCAESTNFAVPEWVPMGEKANICMCRPHSVRIVMHRFKALLRSYDEDALERGPNESKLSYSRWAKECIRSKIGDQMNVDNEIDIENASEGQSKRKSKPKSRVVEVMKLTSIRGKEENKKGPSKKRKVSKKKKNINFEDFRLAQKMKVSLFRTQTAVLCLLECDGGNEAYFAGSIVDIVDDHAKVHFSGSTRSEDVWLSIGSKKIFLDGGHVEK
mmetsp:Transcript_29395/g.44866  ORF Transcript_29395/g.44866 Transcript_29395/m.44866 type:complete len:726 (-) Transcript_29395:250-2427(-)|eukprot:CAMPEP_0194090536 /NCGR_PEP_ID=MMETSP0149-20130528/39476_1 /TAXON_ID=122233 /ORGANISM="Chaetoceros debilis, Strain MM31A-1" /LENGTH=725 /DNA_ID=CAMNT_0038774827 /DNA_START=39 /DNA_END=2216 /DNA_ORIENTATION=+